VLIIIVALMPHPAMRPLRREDVGRRPALVIAPVGSQTGLKSQSRQLAFASRAAAAFTDAGSFSG
jgi:hypothetical protein